MKLVLMFAWVECMVGRNAAAHNAANTTATTMAANATVTIAEEAGETCHPAHSCTNSCDDCCSGTVCRDTFSGYECSYSNLVCGECTGGSFDACAAACSATVDEYHARQTCRVLCEYDCRATIMAANATVAIAEEADGTCLPANSCTDSCDDCCSGTVCRRSLSGYECNELWICKEPATTMAANATVTIAEEAGETCNPAHSCTHSCDDCCSGTVCRGTISGYECSYSNLVCGECTGGSFDTCVAACSATGESYGACLSVCKADCPATTEGSNTTVAIAEEADGTCLPANSCPHSCDDCCSGTICRGSISGYECNGPIACGARECAGGSFDSCVWACSITGDDGECLSVCKADCPATTVLV